VFYYAGRWNDAFVRTWPGKEVQLMTQLSGQLTPPGPATTAVPAAGLLARRLAAAGLGVQVSDRAGTCELAIVGVARGKALVALEPSGQARWYYEPAGPAASPATLTAIIAYLLNAPSPASLAAYRALPLKGQVGRALQDQGLTVTLRVSEDLESFEATTDIEVTSPAHPHLGTVRLSDDAAVDWCLDGRAAFPGNPAALIDVITPILRASHTERLPG
jgi:hypothetical protein